MHGCTLGDSKGNQDGWTEQGYRETRRDLRRISPLLFDFKSSDLLSSSRSESVSVTPVAQATYALLKRGLWRRGTGEKTGNCPAHLECSVLSWAKPPQGGPCAGEGTHKNI